MFFFLVLWGVGVGVGVRVRAQGHLGTPLPRAFWEYWTLLIQLNIMLDTKAWWFRRTFKSFAPLGCTRFVAFSVVERPGLCRGSPGSVSCPSCGRVVTAELPCPMPTRYTGHPGAH